ncbi:MAG: oligoendopeptidase F [Clostridia bacterium]|nr:oligoendopeptidase F [Clostridia bacterium]
MERKDIDKKYKWDLTVLYPTNADFESERAACEKRVKAFSAYEKTMCRSGKDLYAALREYWDIIDVLNKLWEYASLNFSCDSTDNTNQVNATKMRNLFNLLGSNSWFVETKILKLTEEEVKSFFLECPELMTFRRMIDKILARKPHTLSDECEMLMSDMENCLGSHREIRSMFASSDVRFGKIRNAEGKLVELTDTNYVTFLMSPERSVRKAAFRGIYKTYMQFANTLSTLYEARIKEETTAARVRKYKDSLTASTFGDEVTPEIYNNLIKAVNGGLQPLYDYYDLKREVLGLDKLHLYDIYTSLVGSLDTKYTYEEAVEEVLKTAEVFGDEYYNALSDGLKNRGWVDVYPCHGKRGGAFSSGAPGTEPYILLNFTETFSDVSTLAHEAGHSMHTWFSTKYNEPHNSSYRIFVAEVASTVNELLMAHRKLRECESDDEKLYILNQLMETYKGTLYRQTMFAEFERDAHALSEKGEPLTKERLCKHYYKLVKKYFGKNVACDKEIAYEWIRIPHFYTCFYVYKYATCISAASAIVKRIETEGDSYIGKYIDFLKCGDSKSPLDSLLVAGIDMRDPSVVEGAIEDFASAVKQFKEIYNSSKK